MQKLPSKKQLVFAVVVVFLAMIPVGVQASTPESHAVLLTVSDQQPVDGKVIVDSVFSHGPGYIVIYGDYQGTPAPPVGHVSVNAGWNYNVEVPITMSRKLSTAYAILHGDNNQIGVYEFGMAWGADAPALVDGIPVTVAFKVYYPGSYPSIRSNPNSYPSLNASTSNRSHMASLTVLDQSPVEGTVTISSVYSQGPGSLVIYSASEGAPALAIGRAWVNSGWSSDIQIPISMSGEYSSVYAVLRSDAWTTYAFNTLDSPVKAPVTATFNIYYPGFRVN